jgi:hypothetical protein
MLDKFSSWYFGTEMEGKDKQPYLHCIFVTHLAALLAMFGPVQGLGPAMWTAAMLLDFYMHIERVDGRYPLSMLGGLCILIFTAIILLTI